jgi:hypothetical protein
MKLTIHIGTTKTGSTSIQAFLAANRDALAAQGVLYPLDLGPQHHVNATVAALSYGKSPDLLRFCKITDNEAHDAFRVETAAAFQRQLAQSSTVKHAIISSEHLHSRCTAPQDIQRFRDLFCQGFDEVEIVVYIRSQIDHMVSLFSTKLRHGFNGTLDDHIEAMLGKSNTAYFDLQNVITRWADVFGKDAVIVRPFAALDRKTGGAVSDFCAVTKIDTDVEGIVQAAPQNESINAKGQELLMILNKGAGIPIGARRDVVAWLEKEFNGSGFKPSPKAVKKVCARFEEGNAWVTQTYFPNHPEYLTPCG